VALMAPPSAWVRAAGALEKGSGGLAMRAPASVGQRLEDVDTPALLIDLEKF